MKYCCKYRYMYLKVEEGDDIQALLMTLLLPNIKPHFRKGGRLVVQMYNTDIRRHRFDLPLFVPSPFHGALNPSSFSRSLQNAMLNDLSISWIIALSVAHFMLQRYTMILRFLRSLRIAQSRWKCNDQNRHNRILHPVLNTKSKKKILKQYTKQNKKSEMPSDQFFLAYGREDILNNMAETIDAAGWIRLLIYGGRVSKAYHIRRSGE